MILKIKDGRRWIYIDKVARVFTERINWEEAGKQPKKFEGAMIFFNESTNPNENVLEVLIVHENKTGQIIVTNGETYLLNDEGKTIERL